MTHFASPLRSAHEHYAQQLAERYGLQRAEAHRPGAATGKPSAPTVEYLPYTITGADQTGDSDIRGEIVATFGEVEIEYASIRQGVGVMDQPQRATLEVTGADRRDFLNRMLTQELKDLEDGVAKQSFWLNRKGRIEADLLLAELDGRIMIDLDIYQAASTVRTLNEFVFTEDVQIIDRTNEIYRLSLHGKRANAACGTAACGLAMTARTITIAATPIVVIRRDQVGEPGLELFVPRGNVEEVWEALLRAESMPEDHRRRVRAIGWYAYNIARIEASTPLFNIDFTTANLPHETSLNPERVSFRKGCYLGQEIVARMESLGKPKQVLVGLQMKADLLPVAGAQVFARNDDGSMGDEIGRVTSSTLSPMMGSAAIAFAMIKTKHAVDGQTLLVNAEGEQGEAVVHPFQIVAPPDAPPPPAPAPAPDMDVDAR